MAVASMPARFAMYEQQKRHLIDGRIAIVLFNGRMNFFHTVATLFVQPKFREGLVMAEHRISGAIKKPGALHRELHVPAGERIPEKKLQKAEHAKKPNERRRAHLAEELEHFRHK
jgi:hypothetical protein